MNREEFFALAGRLVGEERGKLVRLARLLGVSVDTLYQVHHGAREVPPEYARRLRQADAEAGEAGRWVPFLLPRLDRAVDAAVRAGASDRDAWAAVAAGAALRLSGSPGAAGGPRRRG